jgi:hypothetical protein
MMRGLGGELSLPLPVGLIGLLYGRLVFFKELACPLFLNVEKVGINGG